MIQSRAIEVTRANQRLIEEIQKRESIEDERKLLQERQDRQDRLVTFLEDESNHLSREIHDVMGLYLTALSTEIRVLGEMTDGHNEIAPENSPYRAGGLASSRNSTFNLQDSNPEYEGKNLTEFFQNYIEQWSGWSGTDVEFIETGQTHTTELQDSLFLTLFRSVQEALANVAKHVNATRISLIIDH
jgi:signal transduction histidine kinase